jgi:hypothetical protein
MTEVMNAPKSPRKTLLRRPIGPASPAHLMLVCLPLLLVNALTGSAAQAPQSSASSQDTNAAPAANSVTRGQKLYLKDGSFQLVREYAVTGARVRYYSLDTHQFEEIPAAMVDWDATKTAADTDAKQAAAVTAAIEAHDKAQAAQFVDVDASIEVGPDIFLPPDVGLFAFDGKRIFPVSQAPIKSDLVKKNLLEQMVSPVPIVPTAHRVSIVGPRAKLRLNTEQPEFYIRTADGREPDIDLVHVKVKGDRREVEEIDQLMQAHREKRDSMLIQRWTIAPGVYRFSLGQSLPAGEYVIAESLNDAAMSLYVWDFGVDLAPAK